jgi:hypothetical protein
MQNQLDTMAQEQVRTPSCRLALGGGVKPCEIVGHDHSGTHQGRRETVITLVGRQPHCRGVRMCPCATYPPPPPPAPRPTPPHAQLS